MGHKRNHIKVTKLDTRTACVCSAHVQNLLANRSWKLGRCEPLSPQHVCSTFNQMFSLMSHLQRIFKNDHKSGLDCSLGDVS